jgi:anti-anti-sigma factor
MLVTVDGELDIDSVPRLRERLRQLQEQHAEVVLDLTAVTFMDSTTVCLLWSLRDRLRRGKLVLVPPIGQARELLELTGIASETAGHAG